MKSLAFIFFFVMHVVLISAQKQDIDVYEKKDGDKILVIARNTGQTAYHVKVKITSTGMDVVPSANVEATVPAGYMKEMATITPRPGESWSYGFDVTYTQVMGASSKPSSSNDPAPTKEPQKSDQEKNMPSVQALSDAAVVLYSKPGCGRCTYAKKQMTAQGINFLEINTESDSPEVSNMWSQLRNQGFSGGSVTMPVIRVNGKYHYDIPDLNSFVTNIKS